MATVQKRIDLTASIVIPTFAREGLAGKLKKQIEKYHGNKYQVIIVKSSGNTSITKNTGIEKSSGEVIIFFDDDVEITAKTIPSHLAAYKNTEVMGVGGRVINDGEKIPVETGVETGKTNFLGTKFDYKFWSTRKQVIDFVYGCNMSFRKSALKKTGGFDENLPKIFEEVDLSKRIKKYGKIIFKPQALVYHHKAKSGGIRPEEKVDKQKLIFSNYGYYLAKNISFPLSLLSLALRMRSAFKISTQTVIELLKEYFNSLFLNKNVVQLITIIAISIFFRFWKLGEFFTFNFDEEYQILLAWEQVKNPHPIWVGVSASNVNYYLGPGFTYLTSLLLFVSKDLLLLAAFGSFLGVVNTIIIYYLVRSFFTKTAAVYSAIIYAGSSFLVYFDRRYWSATPVVFVSLCLFFSLLKAEKNKKWLIAVIFLMGVALHVHLSLLAFIPAILIFIFFNFRKIKPSTYILSLVSFLVITSPLLIFDINHNFDNLLMPVRYAQKLFSFAGNGNVFSGVNQLLNTLTRVWYLNPGSNFQDEIQLGIHGSITETNIYVSLFSLMILVYIFYLSIRESKYRLLSIAILSFLTVYVFYPGGVVAYYLLGFFALFSIATGIFFSRALKFVAIPVVVLFLSINVYSLLTSRQEQFGLKTREKLIQKIMPALKNESFYLETRTNDGRKYHSAGGWRYLFKAYGRTPSQSHADEFFGWIYADEISKNKPDLRVIISEYPAKVDQQIIKQFNEGVYYGYVVINY